MTEPASDPGADAYPPIADYGFISDCHSAALVSRTASIDWCCMPRMDRGSCFGRLLDWNTGGHCRIHADTAPSRRYLDGTLVLETTLRSHGGEARVLDCFPMHPDGRRHPYRQLLRIIDGVRGRVRLGIEIAPRFDYGEVRPWLRQERIGVFSATGGDDCLVISGDLELRMTRSHDLTGTYEIRSGERARLSIVFTEPEDLDAAVESTADDEELDRRLDRTIAWWQKWTTGGSLAGPDGPAALRSAVTLRGLVIASTGALAAAATTSLPEVRGGERNWDYRFSWVRDSCYAVRSLAELGFDAEADGFRRFIERSSAGSADDLQIMYGLGGERRLTETTLDHLEGYGGARPVHVGNDAARQVQLDVYGELVELAWRWHGRGHSPDDDSWRFLVELVDAAAERSAEPDRGIWELRGDPRHLVHSKVMCWAALDRAIRLADECQRKAPQRRWRRARAELKNLIETRGYDKKRGVFVQSFDSTDLDAALLRLPSVGFVRYDDERMIRTTDAIRDDLGRDGLLRRYRSADGLPGNEGVFLPCSFWLVECMARQGRQDEARDVFDRATATSNDLGLFSEEYDTQTASMLGNFPQALTHLSHIAAAVALADRDRADWAVSRGT